MPVPTYDHFIEPVLRTLAASPDGLPARDVHATAARALGLSQEEMGEYLPSGNQLAYKNRAGWAHDRLKRCGLSSSPRRGLWRITEEGLAFLAARPGRIDEAEIDKLASTHLTKRLGPTERQLATRTAMSPPPEQLATPDERLHSALQEIRDAVVEDLIEILMRVSPSDFERLVLEVLHQMGYGATEGDVSQVGGPGDGGIDGVISLDKLGLEKVYVQAKRINPRDCVGRPEVQAFYGALAGLRGRKGVFITTTTFSQPAVEFARTLEGIVLIDGSRLAELMIDHGIGVTLKPLQVPRIDSDYFESE